MQPPTISKCEAFIAIYEAKQQKGRHLLDMLNEERMKGDEMDALVVAIIADWMNETTEFLERYREKYDLYLAVRKAHHE